MSAIRLSKVTKKYGIGFKRLVEFLNANGVTVEKNPNAKIPEEYLPIIDAEFGKAMKLNLDTNNDKIKFKDIIDPEIGNISELETKNNTTQSVLDSTEALDNSVKSFSKRAMKAKRNVEMREKQNMQRMEKILPIAKRLIKLLFNAMQINPQALIDTNATINDVNALYISATFDNGQDMRFSTKYLIGNISIGARMFCRQVKSETDLISTTIIQECSYADFMRLIIRVFNEKDTYKLGRILKLIWVMPTFSGSVEVIRKIYKAITHPTVNNLETLELMLSEKKEELQKQYESSISNYADFKQSLDAENALYDIDKMSFRAHLRSVKRIVDEFHYLTPICNSTILQLMPSYAIAELNGQFVHILYKQIIDKELIVRFKNNPDIQRDVVLQISHSGRKEKHHTLAVFGPCTFTKLYDIIVDYINEGNYYYAVQALEALIRELKIHLDVKESRKLKYILASIKEKRISSISPHIHNIKMKLS